MICGREGCAVTSYVDRADENAVSSAVCGSECQRDNGQSLTRTHFESLDEVVFAMQEDGAFVGADVDITRVYKGRDQEHIQIRNRSELTCGQNDIGDHKGRLVGVERPVHLIDSFLDLQCEIGNHVPHSIAGTHLSRIIWPPIDEKELTINTGPPSPNCKLGNQALQFDGGHD